MRYIYFVVVFVCALIGGSAATMRTRHPHRSRGFGGRVAGSQVEEAMHLEGFVYTTEDAATRTALQNLYSDLSGMTWRTRTNWMTNTHYCQWYGVKCRNQSSIVEHIIMEDNLVKGQLKESVFCAGGRNAAGLHSNLKTLEITYCPLLTGVIPDCGFPELQRLVLPVSRISMNLTEVTIARFPKLKQLDMVDTLLSGDAADLCGFPDHFEVFYFGASKGITGTLVDCFAKFPNITHFDVGQTNVSGTVPASVFSSVNLQEFYMYELPWVYGTLPELPASASSLIWIEITRTKISGTIPASWGHMTSIEGLLLSQNELEGNIGVTLCNMTALTDLGLGQNRFTGTVPGCINKLTALTFFGIERNRLTGLPADFNLPALSQFRMNDNFISGPLPPTLAGMGKLRVFNAASNGVSEKLADYVAPLRDLSHLSLLDVSNNNLTGEFEANMFWRGSYDGGPRFVALQTLKVAKNKLTGKIPQQISWWTRLESLDLEGNEFTGPVIEPMAQFGNLNLRGNKMRAEGTLLPAFLKPDFTSMIALAGENFKCPTVVGKDGRGINVNIDAEYYNFAYCRCDPSFFGVNGSCLTCPDGGVCAGGNSLVYTDRFPTPNAVTPRALVKCPIVIPPAQTACNLKDGKFECAPNYTGRLCANCVKGFTKSGTTCQACSSGGIVLLLIGVFVLMIGYITHYLRHNMTLKTSAAQKLFVLHLQTAGAVMFLQRAALGDITESFGSVADWASFEGLGFSCLTGGDPFVVHSVALLLIPTVCIATVGLIVIGFLIFIRIRDGAGSLNHELRKGLRYVVMKVSLLVVLYFYFPITKQTFSIFLCQADPVTKKMYVAAAPYIECSADDELYPTLLTIGYLGLVFYVILGFVIVTCLLYFYIRGNLEARSRLSLGFLYYHHHPKYYYFEAIMLLRRLAISAAVSLLDQNSEARHVVPALILVFSLVLADHVEVFVTTIDNNIDRMSLTLNLCTAIATATSSGFGKSDQWVDIVLGVMQYTFIFFLFVYVVLLKLSKYVSVMEYFAYKTNPHLLHGQKIKNDGLKMLARRDFKEVIAKRRAEDFDRKKKHELMKRGTI